MNDDRSQTSRYSGVSPMPTPRGTVCSFAQVWMALVGQMGLRVDWPTVWIPSHRGKCSQRGTPTSIGLFPHNVSYRTAAKGLSLCFGWFCGLGCPCCGYPHCPCTTKVSRMIAQRGRNYPPQRKVVSGPHCFSSHRCLGRWWMDAEASLSRVSCINQAHAACGFRCARQTPARRKSSSGGRPILSAPCGPFGTGDHAGFGTAARLLALFGVGYQIWDGLNDIWMDANRKS